MSECHTPHQTPGPVLTPPPYAATGGRLVALIGPPNSGKSTLFNRLTGLRQKVANYPGVTVERHLGRVALGDHRYVDLVDLPGVYSLSPRSEDERVTHDVLTGRMDDIGRPDAALLIIDATNLGRNLAMAAPILELGLPLMLVLNMADDLESRGGSIDTAALERELGVPVALITATTGEGVPAVLDFLRQRVAPPERIELPVIGNPAACRSWAARLSDAAGYRAPAPPEWTRRLDAIVLHHVWGPLVLFVVLALVLWTIFAGAKPAMDGVEAVIASSGEWMRSLLPPGLLQGALIDGVWSGVGSVVVFLPQILILSLFMGLLEDSGYMSRAALIADRTMSRFGLQGKAMIPLVSALACAVPAILSARTIESTRDRLATILVAPFMVCSARLPVYTLLIAAFFPGPAWQQAALLAGLYVLGGLAAFGTAWLLKSSVLRSERLPFVLEMPPYRWPTARSLALRLFDRSRIFLRRAGTVILAVTVVLWILATLPYENGKPPEIANSYAGMIGHAVEPAIAPLGFNWRIGIGLITSLAAREVIVATLGTIYGIEGVDPDSDTTGLRQALQQDMTPASAVALMIFFAFAMQCMSTVAVVRRETGGWKWPVIQFTYMLALAWLGAFAAYRILS